MDEGPDQLPGDEPAQVSQWLFAASPRRRGRSLATLVLVIVLVAIAAVGLLALTAVFFPQ
jgi:hypothetical protein